MPFYDYTCQSCHHSFEKRLSMSDCDLPESEPCPECHQENSVKKDACAPPIVDPVRIGVTRPPSDFSKYVLGKIKHANPKADIGNRRFSINKEV
jgi:putative FmdB family regulatory protein